MLPVLVRVHAAANQVLFRRQFLDKFLQGEMVALFEGGPTALSVVREDDKVIGARRVCCRALQPFELLVHLAQDVKGVLGFDARVMRYLVVPDKGGIGRGDAGEHVADQGVHVQLTNCGRGDGPQYWIPAAALLPVQDWIGLVAARFPELVDLQDDVPYGQEQGARKVVGVGEIGLKVGGVEAGQVGKRAGSHHHIGRVTREHVAPAGAVLNQQAVSTAEFLLQPGHLLGAAGRYDLLAIPVPPAKGRYILIVAEQDAGLAR